jgi:hypothetical protein
MVTQPTTLRPVTVCPAFESVIEPELVSVVPAGTPVFVASGYPQADGTAKQFVLPVGVDPEDVGDGELVDGLGDGELVDGLGDGE